MNKATTLAEFKALFQQELKDDYPPGEIDAFFLLSIEDITGITREEYPLRKGMEAKPKQAKKLQAVIQALKTHKPIQYILGTTEFYGCKLRVNEQVLIPRPETEELVALVLKETGNLELPTFEGLNILDIGTGSGCIAIALKKKMPEANVSAIDVSDEALLVAKANAILNQTKINFLQGDILNARAEAKVEVNASTGSAREGNSRFNIIVSNPPYVRLSEKEKMDKNVVNNEPHLALFVQDEDPLLFYKAISDFALEYLTPTGRLYFEINEALGVEVKKLLEQKGFKGVVLHKDMSGKDRMVSGSKH